MAPWYRTPPPSSIISKNAFPTRPLIHRGLASNWWRAFLSYCSTRNSAASPGIIAGTTWTRTMALWVASLGGPFGPKGRTRKLDHYGGVIAERMEGKRAGLGDSEALRPVLEEIYREVLEILETHFTACPYLFGGLPSIADHVLMGPLFGHLARDPEPSRLMKLRAPRVFRWTEHMNTPEILMPEFADFPVSYLPNDEISRPLPGAPGSCACPMWAPGWCAPRKSITPG